MDLNSNSHKLTFFKYIQTQTLKNVGYSKSFAQLKFFWEHNNNLKLNIYALRKAEKISTYTNTYVKHIYTACFKQCHAFCMVIRNLIQFFCCNYF